MLEWEFITNPDILKSHTFTFLFPFFVIMILQITSTHFSAISLMEKVNSREIQNT